MSARRSVQVGRAEDRLEEFLPATGILEDQQRRDGQGKSTMQHNFRKQCFGTRSLRRRLPCPFQATCCLLVPCETSYDVA